METTIQDLRYGVRTLRKDWAFSAIAVLTLALGIGANTALFSVANGVLFNPLPFPHPERLVALHESKPNFAQGAISYLNFQDWQRQNHSFEKMAISRGYAFSLTHAGDAEQIDGEFITSDFFPLLGVNPLLGRTQSPDEDHVGAGPVAMISAALWQRKFGSDPGILGKTITLDARNYTVIGVVPANLALVTGFRERQVYVPIGQWSNPLLMKRGAGLGIHGIGRLRPQVSLDQAKADMAQVSRNLAAAFPDTNAALAASLVPLKQQVVGEVQPYLIVLLVAVGFVLLIACVNVANLSLARATGRRREFAIRSALGASQFRVIRQLLTESILLAFLSGALGLLIASWGTKAALSALPRALPRANEIGLDGRVLFFTAAISLFAGILFGLAPALRASRADLHDTLKEGGRNPGGIRHRAQGAFVVLEMSLALVLLVGAGLMIRTLSHLWRMDPGFSPHNVLTFNLALPPEMAEAQTPAIRAAVRDIDSRLNALPGVTAVSHTWGALPLAGDDEQLFWMDGQPEPTNDKDLNWAIDYIVGPDYLKVMSIPLKRGRFFTTHDDEHSTPVVVVDEVFASRYFPSQDAIGKRIHIKGFDQPAEIVGVVAHVIQWGLDSDETQQLRSELYVPTMQMPEQFLKMIASGTTLVVRSNPAAAPGLGEQVRRLSSQMSSLQVVFGMQTMDEIISVSLASRRFSMILLASFAALALLLAAIGIYGVISYAVGQRVHEIGIRMALGARPLDILALILGGCGKLVASGIALGLAAAFALTRLMSSMLFGVGAADPVTYLTVALALAGIALAAGFIPALRASHLDPVVALRCE